MVPLTSKPSDAPDYRCQETKEARFKRRDEEHRTLQDRQLLVDNGHKKEWGTDTSSCRKQWQRGYVHMGA